MKQIIHLTKNAIKHLVKLKNKNNCKYILFSAKGGGCNGFGYNIEPTDDEPQKLDEIVNIYDKYPKTNSVISVYKVNNKYNYINQRKLNKKNEIKFLFETQKNTMTHSVSRAKRQLKHPARSV